MLTMRRIALILFWSVISAAFIGPGTVTTAAASGARYGLTLLWALVFSTVACLILQEASARITLVSGVNLGQALRRQFRGPLLGPTVAGLAIGAIGLGCAAYEAGNVLGAMAGLRLVHPEMSNGWALVMGLGAGLLLWKGSTQTVARVLGFIVALMGLAFLVTAVQVHPPIGHLLSSLVTPAIPPGAGLLVIGLIGTTVVPYNLFLGSGIARDQTLGEMRLSLGVAILLGGLISMGVLVVGTVAPYPLTFPTIAKALVDRLGLWAHWLFATGLFAAGFSSAITAPMAAAITARSLFGHSNDGQWHERSWRYRAVWLSILTIGVAFAVTGVRPIPAIIAAQALNGVLLPLVAVFLFIVVNDRAFMGTTGMNGLIANVGMGAIVLVTILLGLTQVSRAMAAALGMAVPNERTLLGLALAITVLIALPMIRAVYYRRHAPAPSGRIP